MSTLSTIGTAASTALVAVVGAAGTAYARLVQSDRNNDRRLSVLESQRTDDNAKLDHIQIQVDRLVDWAMDKKYR